jgi:endo-1,4-beta-xylanase
MAQRICFIVLGIVLAAHASAAPPTLKDAVAGRFLIGAAITPSDLADPVRSNFIANQFTAITAENAFKPGAIEQEPGQFDFSTADKYVDFAQQHGIAMIGHTLCWHQATPAWFFKAADGTPLPREQGLANLKRHIFGEVSHLRGKVRGWDVVNEALYDGKPDPSAYLRDTPARRSIGDDFIIQAYKFAHEADPSAELYYNDYSIERPAKRARALRLIADLKAAGCRIDAIGIQGHWGLKVDPQMVDDAITAFHAAGVKVSITELDIDVLPGRAGTGDLAAQRNAPPTVAENPYAAGCPQSVLDHEANVYASLFRVFVKHTGDLERVTFWGYYDGSTWLNNYPIHGRTNYPFLWDRHLQPKPAFDAVMKVIE